MKRARILTLNAKEAYLIAAVSAAKWANNSRHARNSLQQQPDYLPARLLLGKVLLQSAQWPAAEKELQLALQGQALRVEVDGAVVVAQCMVHVGDVVQDVLRGIRTGQ